MKHYVSHIKSTNKDILCNLFCFFTFSGYIRESVAGTTLFLLMHSFLTLSPTSLYKLLSPFMNIFNALNKLNNLSPANHTMERLEIKWPFKETNSRCYLKFCFFAIRFTNKMYYLITYHSDKKAPVKSVHFVSLNDSTVGIASSVVFHSNYLLGILLTYFTE